MINLGAAVEAAQARGMHYPDAEQLINSLQDLLIADEYKQKADLALNQEQWTDALDLYEKALNLTLLIKRFRW